MKDPICGMDLIEGNEYFRINYHGKEYGFCSEACEGLFRKLNGLKIKSSISVISDNERKMVAYNTLKQVAATIAHYISNANAAISAQAQLLGGQIAEDNLKNSVMMIKKESMRIESVVAALLSITDIKLEKYLKNDEAAIFDLKNSLDELLKDNKGAD